VINMSLGGFSPACPQILQNAITDAVATGSTVVVSAGNDADNALFYSPANCAGVITVHANPDVTEICAIRQAL
jgi:serine protease